MNEGHVFDVTAEQHVLDNPTHVVIVDVNSLVDRPQAERSEWTMVTIACQTCEWWDETGHKPDDNCITQPSKREGWVPRRPVGLGDPDATFPGAEPVEFNRLYGKRKRWDRIAQAAKVAFTRAKEQWQLEELAYRDRMHAHYQSFVTPRRGLVEMPGIPKPQISDRPWDAPPTDYDG
jgi:hypothetical protein